jgi:hypothetical protein
MSATTDHSGAGLRQSSAGTRNDVTEEQVYCLTEMLLQPRLTTQRCVERLAFIPTGGHQWTRDLQIWIPDTSEPEESDWRVISLGAYARRRFPDFTVVDATGQRLSLLTRRQHGFALTQSTVNQLLATLSTTGTTDLRAYVNTVAYREFWQGLYSFFTTSGYLSHSEKIETTGELAGLCYNALSEAVLPSEAKAEYLGTFIDEVVELLDITRYLCWVRVAADEVIDLKVTYSTLDARRKLGRGTIANRLAVLWEGLSEPRVDRWRVWAGWYRQFGVAPLNYEFSVPGSLHAGSYYFTLEPPRGTDVTYLDWETGNSLETSEIDCSTRSAHIHNQNAAYNEHSLSPTSSTRGGTIRAYVHCTPNDHKLIVGTALLNCLFVFLLASGRVHGKIGSPAQSVLLAAPSIYVAYLARQQQHYFADAMRRQRGVLWWYLAFSVGALIALAFGNHDGSQGSEGFSPFATAIMWIWGISSAFVAAWFFPMGGSYERVTESLARRRISKVRLVERTWSCDLPQKSSVGRAFAGLPIIRAIIYRHRWRKYDVIPSWKCYQREVRAYSSQIARLMCAAAASVFAALVLIWHFPEKRLQVPNHRAVSSSASGRPKP